MPRHHYVPQFILRGFADDRDLVRVVAREDLTQSHLSTVRKAASVTGYYSIATDALELQSREGHNPDQIEESLSFVESEAAVEINAIREGSWLPTTEGHYRLIRFVSLQICRVPSFRKDYSDLATRTARRTFRSKITKERVRAHLANTGKNPTDAEVDAFYKEAVAANFRVVPSNEHALQESMRIAIETFMPHLWQRTPKIMRFRTPALMTSDSGVGLWGPDAIHPRSVGVANARAIFLPLDRQTVLAFTDRRKYEDSYVGDFWARHVNVAVSDRATSWLYHHPTDEPLKGVELPPPRRLVSTQTGLTVKNDGTVVSKNVEHWQ